MHSFTNFLLVGLADTLGLLTQSASAADLVQVHNHCSFPLYWWHSASADDPNACDKGVNDLCIGKGGESFEAAAGSAHGYGILKNDKGVSVKIRRGDKCKKNAICVNVYQEDDRPDAKSCRLNTGEMHLYLCMSDADFFATPLEFQQSAVKSSGRGVRQAKRDAKHKVTKDDLRKECPGFQAALARKP